MAYPYGGHRRVTTVAGFVPVPAGEDYSDFAPPSPPAAASPVTYAPPLGRNGVRDARRAAYAQRISEVSAGRSMRGQALANSRLSRMDPLAGDLATGGYLSRRKLAFDGSERADSLAGATVRGMDANSNLFVPAQAALANSGARLNNADAGRTEAMTGPMVEAAKNENLNFWPAVTDKQNQDWYKLQHPPVAAAPKAMRPMVPSSPGIGATQSAIDIYNNAMGAVQQYNNGLGYTPAPSTQPAGPQIAYTPPPAAGPAGQAPAGPHTVDGGVYLPTPAPRDPRSGPQAAPWPAGQAAPQEQQPAAGMAGVKAVRSGTATNPKTGQPDRVTEYSDGRMLFADGTPYTE
jgi:hypothetical protein